MSQLFRAQADRGSAAAGDDAHSLKRVLGAGDLVMLAIGAVIGAGIFGAIGTAAAGQIGPNGEVIRYGAGPALIFSFILLGGACALAALCYAELAAMIPQAGSAYAYSYATLGELVAWIIGWDLILEYAVGNVAVAISWGDYFNTLLRGVGVDLPVWLTTGYRTALLSANPDVHALLDTAPQIAGIPILVNLPAFGDRDAHHLAAAARRARELDGQQRHGRDQAAGARAVHRRRPDEHQPRQLHAVCAERLHRHPPGRGDRLLRLHRLRRDFDRGRGDEEPAAQPADRHSRRAGHLHGHLRDRRRRAHRHGAVRPARRRRSAGARAGARPGIRASAGSSRWAPSCRCRRCCSSSSTASRASSSRWRATACCPHGPPESIRRRASRT